MHWCLQSQYGLGLMAGGLGLKIITAYFRTPKNFFEENQNISAEEFTEKLEEYVDDLNEKFPIICWLSRAGSWFFLAGLIVKFLEIYSKF